MQTTVCTSRCRWHPAGHHDLSDEELSAAAGGVSLAGCAGYVSGIVNCYVHSAVGRNCTV